MELFLRNILLSILYASRSTYAYQITIVSLSNSNTQEESVIAAQLFAIEEINSRADFLTNITLNLTQFTVQADPHQVMIAALDIINLENTANNAYFPIILGAPWSLFSTLTAPVLGAVNMGQISASSTSIALSNTALYPYFYRTMASDALQAQGLIVLCKALNWTSIAVVYVSDTYGLHLNLGITKSAAENNISVTSMGISYDDSSTFVNAAQQIRFLKKYIVILITHNHKILDLFAIFDSENIIGYPYIYLAVDAWLDQVSINEYNLTKLIAGFIGTTPWQPDSFKIDDDTTDIIIEAKQKYENLLKSCDICAAIPSNSMIYGYDTLYTLAYAIQEIEDNPTIYGSNIYDMLLNYNDSNNNNLIKILNEIITQKIDFVGASGHVSFDEIGDRINGMYSFANILNDGSINCIGYLYYNGTSYVHVIDVNKIVWPSDFPIAPRSHQQIDEAIIKYKLTNIVICILAGLSILYALFIAISIFWHRKNIIIVKAAWKLRILLCIGAILAYYAVILYSLHDGTLVTVSDAILQKFCNIRICLLIVSYSIIFIPLFVKTYRVTYMFNTALSSAILHETITDKASRMKKKILKCVAIDVCIHIILVTIFVYLEPYEKIKMKYEVDEIDKLRAIQYTYCRCSFENKTSNLILGYFVISIKVLESLFGVYVVLDTAQMFEILSKFKTFDEIGLQLFSIILTFIVICLSIPIVFFGPTKQPNFYYLIISITILLIGNIVLSLNLLPRLIAVIKNKEDKFLKTVEEKIEEKVKELLQNRQDKVIKTGQVKINKEKSKSSHQRMHEETTTVTKWHDHLQSAYYENKNTCSPISESIENEMITFN